MFLQQRSCSWFSNITVLAHERIRYKVLQIVDVAPGQSFLGFLSLEDIIVPVNDAPSFVGLAGLGFDALLNNIF